MAKLTRKQMKVFGSSAGLNEISEIGSLAAGTPVFSTDPDVIQSLANYLDGWFAVVVGANSPAIEDMNALCYLYAYQLAYLMQDGVPEWLATTTYYQNSIAMLNGRLYVSLTDDNLNNSPTSDTTNWTQPVQNGVVTPNTYPGGNKTVATGQTLSWPNMTIPTGKTFTVQTDANMIAFTSLILEGTSTIVVQGTGTVRII